MKFLRHSGAIRVSIGYGLIAGLWILLSDNLVAVVTSNQHEILLLSIYKGWGFVAITAILLYIERKRAEGKFGVILEAEHRARSVAEEAQEELRLSEERYRILINTAQVPVVVTSLADGRVRFVNSYASDFFGVGEWQAFGKHAPAFWTNPADRERFIAMLEKGPVTGFESMLIGKNGVKHTVLVSGNLIVYDGEPCSFTVFMDITERKRVLESLRESEMRFSKAFHASPIGIAIMRLSDNRFTDVNDVLARTCGYERADMVGRSSLELGLWPDPVKRKGMMHVLVEEGSLHEFEAGLQPRSGGLRTVLISAEIIELHGEPHMLGLVHDITNRRKAQEELLRARDFTEHLLETANVIFLQLDLDGTVLKINHAAEEITGYRKDEIEGKNWFDILVPRERYPYVWKAFLRVKESGEIPGVFENPIRTKNGEERDILWRNDVVREGGKIRCTISFGVDITDRKLVEQALQRSEEQFRLISENVADMIAVYNVSGKRIYNSPSFNRLLGKQEELQEQEPFAEIYPEDRERMLEVFRRTVENGLGERAEYRIIASDGNIRHLDSQGSIIHGDDGKVFRVIIVSRDITEQKKLEAQFLRMQRLESIGALAGGIAHDLNNVLSPILLSVELIRKRFPDEQSQRLFQTVGSAAQRGADLVKQVLSFARGVEGARTLVQVRHLIDEIVKIVRETFPKPITLSTKVEKNLSPISADATQLHQVLMNLCVNARDAMPNGGHLEINAKELILDEQYVKMNLEAKPGPYVTISVTDQGMGMSPAVLERIFEPFFTTKDLSKGTGLGLSTVRTIVKSHNGFINVYSEVGKGTTFRIYLPAQQSGRALVEVQKAQIPLGNGELLLVVDDESGIREITKSTLEAYGYRVMTAADGAEALAMYAKRQGKIDLVVTDMMMPYMDGAATIRALRRIDEDVKVIAVSGLRQSIDDLKDQPVVFLHKPYTAAILLTTIHDTIHGRPYSIDLAPE